MSDSKLVPLGAVWKQKDKNGNTYLSGSMGDAKLLILANKNKESDKHPDFRVFVAPKEKQQRPAAPQRQAPQQQFDGGDDDWAA